MQEFTLIFYSRLLRLTLSSFLLLHNKQALSDDKTDRKKKKRQNRGLDGSQFVAKLEREYRKLDSWIIPEQSAK